MQCCGETDTDTFIKLAIQLVELTTELAGYAQSIPESSSNAVELDQLISDINHVTTNGTNSHLSASKLFFFSKHFTYAFIQC